MLAFLALFDHRRAVALPAPGYPCYRHILTALGQKPVPIVTDAAGTLDADREPDRGGRPAGGHEGLVIASPANPTGTMLEPGRLAEIAELCRRNGVWFVSDEIYHGLTYGMSEQTALAHTQRGRRHQQLLQVLLA